MILTGTNTVAFCVSFHLTLLMLSVLLSLNWVHYLFRSRSIEHAHVTANLAHILHRVQLTGKMSLDKFESAIDPEQYKKCEAK